MCVNPCRPAASAWSSGLPDASTVISRLRGVRARPSRVGVHGAGRNSCCHRSSRFSKGRYGARHASRRALPALHTASAMGRHPGTGDGMTTWPVRPGCAHAPAGALQPGPDPGMACHSGGCDPPQARHCQEQRRPGNCTGRRDRKYYCPEAGRMCRILSLYLSPQWRRRKRTSPRLLDRIRTIFKDRNLPLYKLWKFCVEAYRCWCAAWTSNPVIGANPLDGGFDSHTLPPSFFKHLDAVMALTASPFSAGQLPM